MTEPTPPPSSELRSRRRQAIIGSVLLGVLTLVFVGGLVTSYVRNAPLRGEGLVSTQATVTDFDYNRRRSDEVSVSYDVPGQGSRSADIPVSRRFDEGETVAVEYSPDDPGLVRTVDDWAPSYSSPLMIVVAALVVVVLVYTLVGIARPSILPSTEENRSRSRGKPLGASWVRLALLAVALVAGFLIAAGR